MSNAPTRMQPLLDAVESVARDFRDWRGPNRWLAAEILARLPDDYELHTINWQAILSNLIQFAPYIRDRGIEITFNEDLTAHVELRGSTAWRSRNPGRTPWQIDKAEAMGAFDQAGINANEEFNRRQLWGQANRILRECGAGPVGYMSSVPMTMRWGLSSPPRGSYFFLTAARTLSIFILQTATGSSGLPGVVARSLSITWPKILMSTCSTGPVVGNRR